VEVLASVRAIAITIAIALAWCCCHRHAELGHAPGEEVALVGLVHRAGPRRA
jgi:hypothetical protein